MFALPLLLIYGSLWFWSPLVLVTLFLFAAVEFEWPGRATCSLVVLALVYTLFSKFNPFLWLIRNRVIFEAIAGSLTKISKAVYAKHMSDFE